MTRVRPTTRRATRAAMLAAVGFAETNWNEARRFLPILAAPFFTEVRSDAGSSPGDDSLIERLAGSMPRRSVAS